MFRPRVEYLLDEALDLLIALRGGPGHLEEQDIWTTLLPTAAAQEAILLDKLAP